MNDVLFTRNMQFVINDTGYPCSAKFSTPVFVDTHVYATQTQLIGFGNETVVTVYGFDPMASLLNAMIVAGEAVKAHAAAATLDVSEIPNFGFPLFESEQPPPP
jgi:hypothetical protein